MNSTDYPGLYQDAEAASSRAQTQHLRVVMASMVLLVTSALISLVEFAPVWTSLLQTMALLGSLAITAYLAQQQPQKVWHGTRALAEAIKSHTWRFMMRAEPYSMADAIARASFLSDLGGMVRDNPLERCAFVVSEGDQITSCMIEIRNRAVEERKKIYELDRVRDQLNWYKNKVQSNARLASRWFAGLVSLQVLAVTCALARFAFPTGPHWPAGVFSAAAAAAMAWIQVKQFKENAASFSLAAHELSLLRARLPDVATDQDLSTFVVDGETMLSQEQTRWLGTTSSRFK